MRFSIISTDYEMYVPRQEVQRGIDSVASQTFDDFEWIIVHDGPKKMPYHEEYNLSCLKNKPIIVETDKHMGDWGLHGRDHIMKNVARGDFFIQFNINNILYPHALKTIDRSLRDSKQNIAIFGIMHHKFKGMYFPGFPRVCGIDLLQLVAHRNVWKDVGYFFNKSNIADGIVYQKMCQGHSWTQISETLGENF